VYKNCFIDAPSNVVGQFDIILQTVGGLERGISFSHEKSNEIVASQRESLTARAVRRHPLLPPGELLRLSQLPLPAPTTSAVQ